MTTESYSKEDIEELTKLCDKLVFENENLKEELKESLHIIEELERTLNKVKDLIDSSCYNLQNALSELNRI